MRPDELDAALRRACLANMRKQLAGEMPTEAEIAAENAALADLRERLAERG